MVQFKRGFVDTPHGQVHYRAGGEGPPVVVLHPTPSSSRAMLPFLEALAERGVRAIGMDTMGFGDSDRPPAPYTTQHEYAQAVVWLIRGLGYEKATVVGILTGSQIALQVAADFPEAVDAVVVQEAFNWGTPSRRAVHERLHRYHPRTDDGSYLLELWNRSRGASDLRAREASFKERLTVNDDLGAEVYGTMGWEGAATWSMCRTDMWEVAPRIAVPALVTYIENSELGRAYDRFMQSIPSARGLLNAPSLYRDPAGFAGVVVDFARSVVPNAQAAG
ncbi:MAG: alpha/beta fold hydrolase [Dehalococcoidia bacterium]